MQNLSVLIPRFALAAAIAAVPAVAWGQSGTMASGSSSMGQTSTNMHASASDKKFVRDAAQGGMAEVELGKLATEKASSEQVKSFGQRMVDDHSKANEQLKQVASEQGIQLPDKLNAKDEMTKEHLSKLSGEQFDKAYMNDMVKDHTQDVADFKRESSSGMDPQVKDFASQTLPTLESHLRQAKEIAPTTRSASDTKGGFQ